MSELTQCNRCKFEGIKRGAEREGLEVKLRPKSGGQDVYVGGVWTCWFMELSDSCCC